jgi:hypothetical protein
VKDERRATDTVIHLDRAKIARIEACRRVTEQEELSWSKDTAALPTRQWSLAAVSCQSACHDGAADKDMGAMAADPVAADGSDRLQQVDPMRQIASTVS